MELTAIFFSLAVLILVGMYLYAPFLERRAGSVTEEEHELSALIAERDRVINSLQELDFDFKLGKVPEDDYPVQRASLLQKGADILRKIDSLAPQAASAQDTEERLERAIAARRADASTVQSDVSEEALEIDDRLPPQETPSQVGRLLPQMWQTRNGHRSILPILWKIISMKGLSYFLHTRMEQIMKLRIPFLLTVTLLLAACNFTLAEDVTPPPNYVPPTPGPTLGPLFRPRRPARKMARRSLPRNVLLAMEQPV